MGAAIRPAAWDGGFQHEVNELTLRKIDPAILDIEEAVHANPYLETIARRTLTDPLVLVSGSALTVVLASIEAFPSFAAVAAGGSVALRSALKLLDAHRKWEAASTKTKGNQMYFYYGLRKRLQSQ